MRRMDNMDPDRPRGRGRPRKCPRRELPEVKDTNELNAGEETTDTTALEINNDDNKIAPAQTFEGSPSSALGTISLEVALIIPSPSDPPPLVDAHSPAVGDASVEAVAAVPINVSAPAPDGNNGLPSANNVKPRRHRRKGIPRRSPSS